MTETNPTKIKITKDKQHKKVVLKTYITHHKKVENSKAKTTGKDHNCNQKDDRTPTGGTDKRDNVKHYSNETDTNLLSYGIMKCRLPNAKKKIIKEDQDHNKNK